MSNGGWRKNRQDAQKNLNRGILTRIAQELIEKYGESFRKVDKYTPTCFYLYFIFDKRSHVTSVRSMMAIRSDGLMCRVQTFEIWTTFSIKCHFFIEIVLYSIL